MPFTESVTLNSGAKMPLLGYGTWQIPVDKIQSCVELAIDEGYRHIDGAWAYQNEEGLGKAVNQKIKERKITRNDVFITSKLWSSFHKPDEVRESLLETLKFLNLKYVDLYLMHWPWSFQNVNKEVLPRDSDGKFLYGDTDYVQTWKAMEELKKEGLAKDIGISNFNEFQINRILKECSVVPAVHQIESHPYLTEDKMVEFCKKHNIAVTAYCPLGSKQRMGANPDDPVVMDDRTLVDVANKVEKTVAQVMLRYQVQRGVIIIPKSIKESRIKENSQIFNFTLSSDDMSKISSLNKNLRLCGMDMVSDAKYYAFRQDYTE